MALPTGTTISNFLAIAKASLTKAINDHSNVTIVTGNQSADLDSMSSSILYAFIRSQSPPSKAFTPLYVPLLNVPAADIELRPEFLTVFKRVNLPPSSLITLDDLPPADKLREELPPENTCWILVDHNRLEGTLGEIYSERVHGVVDHHVEEHAVPMDTDPEPRVVEDCGSCTSLVLRTLLGRPKSSDVADVSFESEAATTLSPAAATLALASITIDTRNLKNPDKTRRTDVAVADFCDSRARLEDRDFDQEDLYAKVHKAKKDIEALPLQGILRKDYKQFSDAGMQLGMSTAVKALDFLVDKAKDEADGDLRRKEAWNEASAEFMRARKLGIWAIMTSFSAKEEGKDEKQSMRQLCVQYKDGGVEAQAMERFEKQSSGELKLEEIKVKGIKAEATDGYKRKLWSQDPSKSRKQVAPLIRAAIKGDAAA